jgi:hypothetical protein
MHERNDSTASRLSDGGPRRRRMLMGRAPRTRSVVVATGLLVVALAPFGVAATGDSLREGRRNGTTVRETEIISNIGSSTGLKGGYATRQSNLSSSGGGAVYGCRSQAGGSRATPTPQNPCIRANNLSRGLAFEFNATLGDVAGALTAGAGGDTKKPFVTNATGVATGLNADRVDSLDAAQIVAQAREGLVQPFAQVTAGGTPGETRGVPAGGVTIPAGDGTYSVVLTGDLSKCALSATITGATPGEVTVTPTVAADKKTTTVEVRTFNSAGTAADRALHLSANC